MNILASTASSDWVELLTPIFVAAAIVIQRIQSKQVKVALNDAAVKSDSKLNVIHGLVNGNMGEQKRITMMQAKRIAELTNSSADKALAINAERLYRDHISRQNSELASEITLEHRVLMTDGPAVTMILERLENIENNLKSLKCNKVFCPEEPLAGRASPTMQTGNTA